MEIEFVNLCRPGNIISKLIRLITRSKSSHSGIKFKFFTVSLFYHSTGKGMHFSSWPYIKEVYTISTRTKITGFSDEVILGSFLALVEKIDLGYDFASLFGNIFVRLFNWLFGWFGLKINKNIIQNKEKFFCSEVLYSFFEEIEKRTGEIIVTGKIDRELMSPADFDTLFKTDKRFNIIYEVR